MTEQSSPHPSPEFIEHGDIEAYIPLSPSARPHSIDIMAEMTRRLGAPDDGQPKAVVARLTT